MGRIMYFLINVVLVFGALFFVAYHVIKFLASTGLSRGSMSRQLKKMTAGLRERASELVPWNKNEIELISLDLKGYKSKKFGKRDFIGFIRTIYGEPILSYHLRRFSGNPSRFLLSFRSSEDFYEIHSINKEMVLSLNGDEVAKIKGMSLVDKSGKILATMQSTGQEYEKILVMDRDMGHLKKMNGEINNPERAFLMVEEDQMDETQVRLFTALSVYKLLKHRLLS